MKKFLSERFFAKRVIACVSCIFFLGLSGAVYAQETPQAEETAVAPIEIENVANSTESQIEDEEDEAVRKGKHANQGGRLLPVGLGIQPQRRNLVPHRQMDFRRWHEESILKNCHEQGAKL